MSVAQLVHDVLANDAGVAALVSDRIHPVILPQRVTLPAISYQRISSSVLDGTSTLRRTRWQIDGWAATYAGAIALAAAIKPALDAWTAGGQTPGVRWADIIDELDDFDSETKTYRISIDALLVTNGE